MSGMKLLPSALSIYEKYEKNQLRLTDLDREDLHFKLKTGADILIEENGIHGINPFSNSVEDIYNWSDSQGENFQILLEQYTKTYNLIRDEFVQNIIPTYKPFYGEVIDYEPQTTDEILDFCRDRISFLRLTSNSVESLLEVRHRKENIFDILYFESNKNLEDLVVKTYLDHLSITNSVTILQTLSEREEKIIYNDAGEEEILPENYSERQRTYSIGELVELMSDPKQNDKSKETRPIVFPMTSGNRTTGEIAYTEWSGLQVFDLDLKFSPTFLEKYGNDASKVRDILFDKLKHYPWLLGITLSSSGRGCHVYTKVSRMHHLFEDDEHNGAYAKYWYQMSYIQKHGAIAYILDKHCGVDVYNEDKVIDSSASHIGQGIAMNYDPEARWSKNFIDLYPVIFYHIPPEKGVEPNEWLLHPKVLSKYTSWFVMHNRISTNIISQLEGGELTVIKTQGELKLIVDETISKDGITQIDMNQLKKGDKYTTRWRIINTIMYAYGDTKQARDICHHILQSTKTRTQNTIESFIQSAVVNQKEADMGTIRQLRKLGLNIKLEEETVDELSDDTLTDIKFSLDNSEYGFVPIQPHHVVELDDGEYLGMRMKEVLSSLMDFKVNIIESAPNTGKTEFFKSLAKTKTVCLVIPFTSTIQSKIVYDDSINDLFDVYFGETSVKGIKKGRSVVMTFDKFSHLSKSQYDLFDYVAIDESHLLFTSTYRLPVVSQTIENIRTYLDHDISEVRDYLNSVMSIQNLMGFLENKETTKHLTKFILMTGTITGELDYFKFYNLLNYITVRKTHPHKKKGTVHISRTSTTRDMALFHDIAESIKNGVKVIHPTNKGDAYTEKVVRCVEYILGEEVRHEYYKRANSDEEFLININLRETTKDIQILFCSDYLSVGIDIKDTDKFKVVFSNDFTAEAIEQFNNRLRSTNIDCNIYYDVVDDEGSPKPNIINTRKIRYEHNDELGKMISDERSIAELQRSIENKNQYHAILGEMFSKYFKQDFAGNIIYIRSAFEIEQFEIQYTSIAKSLLYIKTSLTRKYQYDVEVLRVDEYPPERISALKDVMDLAKKDHDANRTKSFIDLVDFLGDENIYEYLKSDSIVYHTDTTKIEEDDKGLHFGFDVDIGDNGGFVITWNHKHKIMFDKARIFVKRMRKLYSQRTTNMIVRSCLKSSGALNNTEIDRYQNLVNLIFDDRKMTLSASTRAMLEQSYDVVCPDKASVEISRERYEDMKMDIKDSVLVAVKDIINKDIVSQRRHDNINTLVTKFVDTLFKKRVGAEKVILEYRRIFNFDSMYIQMSIERDKIYNRILLNQSSEDFDETQTNWISQEHFEQHQIDEIIVDY